MDWREMPPAEIEQRSFEIIGEELARSDIPEEQLPIVKRVIHTTADFEFADTLYFSPGAVEGAKRALLEGAHIVTDTNMALAGINKITLAKCGGEAHCFMNDEDVKQEALRRKITRAAVCMEKACALPYPLIFAIGNAPTALLRLDELMREGKISPRMIIGVPVGFVNVVESKNIIKASGAPCIIAQGRKGGSAIAATICNALLYELHKERI